MAMLWKLKPGTSRYVNAVVLSQNMQTHVRIAQSITAEEDNTEIHLFHGF